MYVFRRLLAPYTPEAPGPAREAAAERGRKEPVMNRAFFPKAALLLVFILLLAAPVAQAAGRGAHSRPVSSLPGLFDQAWEFLTGVWENNGCRLDPSGGCVPQQNTKPEADNGCRLDPNGGCGQ